MHPLTFLTGIVFGSSGLILLVLLLVMLIKGVLLFSGDLEPARAELEGQLLWLAVFTGLTVVSTASFVSLLRRLPWRWAAQAVLWSSLALLIANLGTLRGG